MQPPANPVGGTADNRGAKRLPLGHAVRVEAKGESRYWTLDSDGIVVGRTLADVVATVEQPRLSVGALAAMASQRASLWLTPFEGVHRLTFGHQLRSTPSGSQTTRWFTPEPEVLTTAEPAAVMREAINHAINAATEGHGGAIVALSGGLDSTILLALAARNPRLHQSLRAYCAVPERSCVSPSRGRTANEWPAAASVAAHIGVHAEPMNSQAEFNWLGIADEHHERHFSPVNATANNWWLRRLEQEATRHDVGIILTGQSGNATFSNGRMNALQPLRADGTWEPAPRAHRAKAALRRARHRTPPQAVKPGIPVEMPSHILDLDPWTRWCLAEPPASGVGPWSGADVVWKDPLGSPEVITAAMSLPKSAWGEKAGDRLLARQVGRGLIPEHVRLNRVRGIQGTDLPGMMLRHADAYTDAVDRVRQSPTAREFLDPKVLTRGLALLHGDLTSARVFQQNYLKPLAVGLFAAWWDDRAPK